MDVADQLQQVGFLLAQYGFIPVLKQPAMAEVTAVETNRIAGQQPPHDHGDRNIPGSQEKVEMIGYQRPSVTVRFTLAGYPGQTLDKIIPIIVVEEKLSPFNPPADDVVQRSGCVDSGLSEHTVSMS